MCDIIKAEFKLRNFSLKHGKKEAFCTSQWEIHPGAYVCYRILVSVYAVACFVAMAVSSISNSGRATLLAYLTIWTYLLLSIYLLLSAAIAVAGYKRREHPASVNDSASIVKERIPENGYQESPTESGVVSSVFEIEIEKNQENGYHNGINGRANGVQSSSQTGIVTQIGSPTDATTWYIKLTWVLGNIVYVFAPVVTIVYFGALFPYVGVNGDFIHDLNMHAFNSVIILVDVFMVARPLRLLHVIHPTIYGLCYIIFSAIYWSFDKENNVLYPVVLDWNHPGTTGIILVCLALVGIPLVQFAHFGLFRLRLIIYRKVYGKDYS